MSNISLPTTGKVCLYSIEQFVYNIKELKKYFDAKGGYSIYYKESPSIEQLIDLPTCSVFFFATHGYFSNGGFCLLTDTPDTEDNRNKYRNLLDSGELIPTYAKTLGITEKFIANHWRFEKNSFVFIHSCNTISENNTVFSNIFKDTCGASVYGGWSWVCTGYASDLAVYFLFDRLLGTNLNDYKESPPQRPFDWVSICKNLRDRNLIRVPYKNDFSEMRLEAGLHGNFGILAPSIHHVDVYEDDNPTLTLHGLFGDNLSILKVFILEKPSFEKSTSHHELAIDPTSDPENIVCRNLPLQGEGADGYVVVAADLGGDTPVLSNPVPLTSWRGTFRYTITGPGSLLATVTCEAHLRGDLHETRDLPGQNPPFRRRGVICLVKDSTTTYEGSGSYSERSSVTTFSWKKTDSMPPVDPTERCLPASEMVIYGEQYPDDHFSLRSYIVFSYGGFDLYVTIENPGAQPFTFHQDVIIPPEMYRAFRDPEKQSLKTPLRLNNCYDITGDCVSETITNKKTGANYFAPSYGEYLCEVQWDTLPAEKPPDSDTPA